MPSNPRCSFLFCFLCRRRLISQRSSLETLEDIEENAPLRRSFYLLSLWLLVCKTCTDRPTVPVHVGNQLHVHVKTFFIVGKVKPQAPYRVVGDMNYTFPGFRALSKKSVFKLSVRK